MATTTNYAWDTPDDTDLVKDGAAAIRTLGSSIDTTTKALNPSTTEGDIEYRSATANTNTRLGIGTDNQVLTVSGGVPVWGTVSGGGMTLLSTTTLSGTSTTVSSISQDYTNLQIIINNPYVNVASALQININGGTSINASKMNGGTAANATNLIPNADLPTATGTHGYRLNIDQYTNTSFFKPILYSGASPAGSSSIFLGGNYTSASAVTSIVFTTASGTSTFSGGTVLIYGVK